jgi:ribosomal protein S18 acetylase RimI-like enzyme
MAHSREAGAGSALHDQDPQISRRIRYAIVATATLEPLRPAGFLGFGKRRRDWDPSLLPRAEHVRVFLVDGRYVVEYGRRRDDDDTVVRATRVSVVDLTRNREVPVEVTFPAQDDENFTIRVIFLCTVVAPETVARLGVDAASALRAHVSSYRKLYELGLNHEVSEVNELWGLVQTDLEAYHREDRLAGLLVLLYAQTASAISQLTLDHVQTGDHQVRLRLGHEPVVLPEPLDILARQVVAARHGHATIGDAGTSPWLFPGGQPGRSISAFRMAERLRDLGLYSGRARSAARCSSSPQSCCLPQCSPGCSASTSRLPSPGNAPLPETGPPTPPRWHAALSTAQSGYPMTKASHESASRGRQRPGNRDPKCNHRRRPSAGPGGLVGRGRTFRQACSNPAMGNHRHHSGGSDPNSGGRLLRYGVHVLRSGLGCDQTQVVGYCVTEYTFFDQALVAMLMVAENARGHGVGTRLLLDAQQRRNTTKLFTSTNLSNQRMQRLLTRLGWQSAGIIYGLDEGDPELFFIAPPGTLRCREAPNGCCRPRRGRHPDSCDI